MRCVDSLSWDAMLDISNSSCSRCAFWISSTSSRGARGLLFSVVVVIRGEDEWCRWCCCSCFSVGCSSTTTNSSSSSASSTSSFAFAFAFAFACRFGLKNISSTQSNSVSFFLFANSSALRHASWTRSRNSWMRMSLWLLVLSSWCNMSCAMVALPRKSYDVKLSSLYVSMRWRRRWRSAKSR